MASVRSSLSLVTARTGTSGAQKRRQHFTHMQCRVRNNGPQGSEWTVVTKVKGLGNGETVYQAPARRKMSYGLALSEELHSKMDIASDHVLSRVFSP